MEQLDRALAKLEAELTVSPQVMKALAASFAAAMTAGLAGKASSLKMLPAFIGIPAGYEQGEVVAVDFGGTNVRVLLLTLAGWGRCNILVKRFFPLKDKQKQYDYTAATASGSQLFDYIAEKIAEIIPRGEHIYPLGYTFSYPCRQYAVAEAELISWTKEIKTAGVEGQNVGQLLQAALERNGIGNVRLAAVINDTTGTLLTAAYCDAAADIGAICGTGHNSCYLEPVHPLTKQPMIVNLESGNFAAVSQTRYDAWLDKASEKPGTQRLEKMAAGQYLGELVRIIISDLAADGLLTVSAADSLQVPYVLSSEDLSAILADSTAGLRSVADTAAVRLGLCSLKVEELAALQQLTRLVVDRSARLVAATWAGVLYKIDPELTRQHTIAVDGSLYEKMPGYAAGLAQAMEDVLGPGAGKIALRLSKDGSGIGAAIAAATVQAADGKA